MILYIYIYIYIYLEYQNCANEDAKNEKSSEACVPQRSANLKRRAKSKPKPKRKAEIKIKSSPARDFVVGEPRTVVKQKHQKLILGKSDIIKSRVNHAIPGEFATHICAKNELTISLSKTYIHLSLF